MRNRNKNRLLDLPISHIFCGQNATAEWGIATA
jgi:hypothetical protein